MYESSIKSLHLAQIYRALYPWTSLNQFVEQLVNTIAYRSHDDSIIALNKPFGVGTYTVQDLNYKKTNQDKLLSNISGSPRYCIQDALSAITDELNSPNPYEVLKSIDRYSSGLVLVTNDMEKHRANLIRSQATTKIQSLPPYGFRAITCGYPIIKSNKIFERVGCQMIEVDELGDHKEPILSLNPGSSFKGKHKDKDLFQAELLVKKINRELSTALVEVHVSKTKWDFVRCYISSKTSFILGDVRFSKRIREVLGKRIQVSAFRSSHNYDTSYEPLGVEILNALKVRKNSSIPLMLDHHELRLKNFFRGKSKDLMIRSQHLPLHFVATAKALDLYDALNVDTIDTHPDENQIVNNKKDMAI